MCAVSGQSLAVYSRISDSEKVSMGKALEQSLCPVGNSSGSGNKVDKRQADRLTDVLSVDMDAGWTDMDITDFDQHIQAASARTFFNCTFNNCQISVNMNYKQV